jgi:mannitol operon transcriptional antiterminator
MTSRKSKPLNKMISPQTTALNVSVPNWEEAVRVSGNLLEKAGFVEKRYIQAMIDSVKDLGPYVVIAPGVAMPHARPEDGVLEPCMSLVTLKEPVNFGNKNNDPVKIIISFGTIDNNAHIDALKRIARIIGDPEKLDKLENAMNFETVKEIIGIQ